MTKAWLLSLLITAALLAIFLADLVPAGMNDGGYWQSGGAGPPTEPAAAGTTRRQPSI